MDRAGESEHEADQRDELDHDQDAVGPGRLADPDRQENRKHDDRERGDDVDLRVRRGRACRAPNATFAVAPRRYRQTDPAE